VVTVHIEFQELWQNAVSYASASEGNLFKLTYLVGMIAQRIRSRWNLKVVLLSPSGWNGQMNKAAVRSRIVRALNEEYGNHVADAVGMGLSLQGWDNVNFWRKVKDGKVRR
jgi:hypothetical protein